MNKRLLYLIGCALLAVMLVVGGTMGAIKYLDDQHVMRVTVDDRKRVGVNWIRQSHPSNLQKALAPLVDHLPKNTWELYSEARPELDAATGDFRLSTYKTPGQLCFYNGIRSANFAREFTEGSTLTLAFPYERFPNNQACKQWEQQGCRYDDLANSIAVTLRFHDNKFHWTEWHESRKNHLPIPAGKQVKHLNPRRNDARSAQHY